MKVLNVCVSLDPIKGGGVVARTLQMNRSLAQSGVECTIISTDLGLTTETREALKGIELIIFPCLNARFYIPKLSYRQIRDAVEKTDIIHFSDYWTLQNAIIYFIARHFRKPYVVLAAGSLNIFGRSKILKKIYNIMIGKRIIRHAAACIAITEDEFPLFKSHGAKDENIVLIPNGINRVSLIQKDDEKFRAKFKLEPNPIILFMGRLNYIKGPDLLLRAFVNLKEKLPQHQLVYAGLDDGMLSELKTIAKENNIEGRVRFLGFLGEEDKYPAYSASELLVIPSRHEAMSIVVLEAGIIGTPVLLTDQCGFDDITSINGGKIVPATVEGLQIALLDMLAKKEELKTMGMNLKNYVTDRFLWDSLVKKYVSLYQNILSKG